MNLMLTHGLLRENDFEKFYYFLFTHFMLLFPWTCWLLATTIYNQNTILTLALTPGPPSHICLNFLFSMLPLDFATGRIIHSEQFTIHKSSSLSLFSLNFFFFFFFFFTTSGVIKVWLFATHSNLLYLLCEWFEQISAGDHFFSYVFFSFPGYCVCKWVKIADNRNDWQEEELWALTAYLC